MEELTFLRRLLAISGAGLAYAQDKFDQERYQSVRDLAEDQMAAYTGQPVSSIRANFADEQGYPTPKVDVRAFIRRDKQFLMVENDHGEWALPGGFAEVGWSLKANVAKEVKEETGLTVDVGRLRAVFDTSQRTDIPQAFQYYKMIFECEIKSGSFVQNSETVATGWFEQSALPPLSLSRTTPEQVAILFSKQPTYIE
ncbi:NUDIX hydrolase [Lacticaseibacillus pantheris]|nr:NUDIX hydrolase [Lacticaseibacillus pantheris]